MKFVDKTIQIFPYEKNAKEHPPKQIELIARSIARFGWQQPIKIGKDNVIIVGHGRFKAYEEYSEKLALKPMWIIDENGTTISGSAEKRKLTEKEERAYRLADNQINALSGNDKGLVIEELKIIEDPYLVELTGFSADLVLEGDEADDAVPMTPKKPQSKLGDLYQLGKHRVLCGDATNILDIEELMGIQKADMFLTDPPYNVDYTGKTKDALKIDNDEMEDDEFRVFLSNMILAADVVLKPGGVFYIWHADSEGYNFRGACHDRNWKVRQCLIWHKNSMVMGRQDYHWKHEPCLYGWKEGASHLWNTDRTQTTVLNFDRPTRSAEHPTIKPVELLAYQITNNTKGEDIVLDTFLGSGSTLIAAQKTGRICYGMEIDPKYCDVIVNRYVQYTGNTNIIKNGKKIVWTTN